MRLQIVLVFANTFRLVLYKWSYLIKRCSREFPIAPMAFENTISSIVNVLNRSRKLVLVIIVIFALLLYLWPSWLKPSHYSRIQAGPLDVCVNAKLDHYRDQLEHNDVVISHDPPQPDDNSFLPFVGNGYMGTVVQPNARLYVRNNRALTVPISFFPIIQVTVEGLPTSEGTALELRNGIVYRIQCYQLGQSCVTVSSQVYAHRSRPAVFVQEFRVHNPTETEVSIDLDQIGVSGWKGSTAKKRSASSKSTMDLQYVITMGTVDIPDQMDQVIVMAVANAKLPQAVSVKPGLVWKYQVVTVVKHSQPVARSLAAKEITNVEHELQNELDVVLNIDAKILRQEHTDVWRKLWYSGFGISLSRAVGVINGDRINSTIYYVASSMRAPLHELHKTPQEKLEYENYLHVPDRCYDGHHTLQNDRLWVDTPTFAKLRDLINTWIITLEKQGCGNMMKAGADGVIQAMILSFGALKFGNDHLEFGTHPKDLHRDYVFRRLNYGNSTHLNISVIVGEDNKANLYVALDRNDKPYFACDAGCLDPPVKLSNTRAQFPVKLTDPVTAILYITYDKQHMTELKEAIHVKAVAEAPAHEQHVMALHRHGHHYGGLPMLFWVSLGFLIIVFHMFLFKLIINEYCQSYQDKYMRNRYNL